MRRRILVLSLSGLAYGREIARGVATYCRRHDWQASHIDLGYTPLPDLRVFPAEGIVAMSADPSITDAVAATGLPAVNVSARFPTVSIPAVWPDNVQAGRLAADHFLQRGFRHFAFLSHPEHWYATQRGQGFREAVEAAGFTVFDVDADFRASPPQNQLALLKRINAWIAALPKPLALLACNDLRARRALEACAAAGVRVPDEVAVLGVDNDESLCDLSQPPLSSIDLQPQRVGYEATALLSLLIDGAPAPLRPILIEPKGVVTRQSTDVLATDDADVAEAVRLIRERAGGPVSVDHLLDQLPLSRRTLERRFREVLGRSPAAEIRRVKLERVRQMLVDTDLPLGRVASACGFKHLQHLSMLFRREVGLTPSAYRQRFRVHE